MDFKNIIIRNPKICGGEPVIKGTRITLRSLLATLAEGVKTERILKDYPSLTEDKLRIRRPMASKASLKAKIK